MGITIFDRTNKGITVSKEGERFLGYAPGARASSRFIGRAI